MAPNPPRGPSEAALVLWSVLRRSVLQRSVLRRSVLLARPPRVRFVFRSPLGLSEEVTTKPAIVVLLRIRQPLNSKLVFTFQLFYDYYSVPPCARVAASPSRDLH